MKNKIWDKTMIQNYQEQLFCLSNDKMQESSDKNHNGKKWLIKH